MVADFVPPIRRVAAAVTTSPRLVAVLAEADRFARRLEVPLVLIHAGCPEPQKEVTFRDALRKVGLPCTTRLVWRTTGDPAEAIAAAAESEGADLVVAGALDRPAVENPAFVGAVARPVAARARSSVLLLNQPQLDPKPFRRIVVMTDFSRCAHAALQQALWLAKVDGAERVEVIALCTAFMQARAARRGAAGGPARTRQETERLLVEFLTDVPASGVALDADVVEGTTGFGAYDFTRSLGADLLVVPAPSRRGGAVPPRMNWALQVTPCSLWVVRLPTSGAERRAAQGSFLGT
ncbi:MAG: universal stress protein [Verrucomicrobia bacterium]|nr:universal stress protein [Verrucomicrobiota bacterium]